MRCYPGITVEEVLAVNKLGLTFEIVAGKIKKLYSQGKKNDVRNDRDNRAGNNNGN